MTSFGIACLVGPPLAGVLVDYTHDYKWPVFVAAVSSVIALGAVMKLRAEEPLWHPSPKRPQPTRIFDFASLMPCGSNDSGLIASLATKTNTTLLRAGALMAPPTKGFANP